jgi:type VI secretion system protein ImpA
MSLCRDRLPQVDVESETDTADPSSAEASAEDDAGGVTTSLGSLGNLNRREDAFRVLEQVADFFRRTEPHSPVSYCVQQAVRWGRMPLNELLTELISDDNVRKDMFRWTGIQNPEEGQE